ncbi:hypothetical protein [Xylanibacter caecicola]|uniref:hypothetical protein n=1 Tax=Xylanibacter caecicola TaxID=2736294 RepID=UPI002584940D|nr:hypothetical protein [Xylanibacter caecicola]
MRKSIFAVVFMFVVICAHAQNPSAAKEAAYKLYNRMSLSYSSKSADVKYIDYDVSLDGIALAWTIGIPVSQTVPLYMETGLRAAYNWGTDDLVNFEENEYMDLKHHLFSVLVPVNLTCRFQIPNTNLRLSPYSGLYMRGNIVGRTEVKSKNLRGTLDWADSVPDDGIGMKTVSFGWHIGAGLEISRFYLGLGYERDLTDFAKVVKASSGFSVTAGVVL